MFKLPKNRTVPKYSLCGLSGWRRKHEAAFMASWKYVTVHRLNGLKCTVVCYFWGMGEHIIPQTYSRPLLNWWCKCEQSNTNKSAQSNLGWRPRRGAVAQVLPKSPFGTMARPKLATKSTPSRGPIAKPHYLPHPWTRPTYDAKRHPDPIHRFSTMHWTDGSTDGR